jgi:adenosylcobinamide-GDP ribazoletransferase
MQSLIAAFKYLTFWGRISKLQPAPVSIGTGAIYFPLVGISLGLVLAILNYGLSSYLDSQILSIFLVATLLIASGGVPLAGTKQTIEAFHIDRSWAPNSRENISGLVAIIFVIMFKVSAIDVLDDKLTLSLLLTPALARWALVIFIYGYHDRCEETPRRIAENVRFWHLLVATLATLGLAVYLVGRKGLWIGLSLSALALFARSLLHRRHAVLTHGNFGAVIELSETLSLVLLASL